MKPINCTLKTLATGRDQAERPWGYLDAWIKQGINLKRLKTWMGHSAIQMTIDTYGHLLAEATGDAALVAAAQAELLA